MRPRCNNPCTFFNTLYSVYWQKNPDKLTAEEFIGRLSPALINNCNNFELLIDVLKKKIDIAYEVVQLNEDKDLYAHYMDTGNYFAGPQRYYDYLKGVPDTLAKLADVNSALAEIKITKKMTPQQQELLKSITDIPPPKNSAAGTTSRTALLFTRLEILCNGLSQSADRKMGILRTVG